MKLLVLSDLHLEFADLALPEDIDFDVAVLAGDIVCPGSRLVDWLQATPALQRARAVVAVAGNHEHYDRVLQQESVAMQDAARSLQTPPLHLLDSSEVRVDGVRFLGCTLWTDFKLRIDTPEGPVSDPDRGIAAALRAMADYRTIGWRDDDDHAAAAAGAAPARRITPQDTLQMHLAQRAWLQRKLAEPFDGATVVVTHHGPHRDSLAARFAADWVSTAYLSELPAVFFEVPVLWVHGHTHTSHDYRIGNGRGGCRVLCNPRGYQLSGMAVSENLAFQADKAVSIDTHPPR